MESGKSLVILGGSSFMGLCLLEMLIPHLDSFDAVHVLNRGRKYWDNRSQKIFDKFSKFKHWKVDRDTLDYSKKL